MHTLRSLPPVRLAARIAVTLLLIGTPLCHGQTPSSADAKKLVLTAEQSTGGNIITAADGTKTVVLEKSCVANFAKPADARIEWKLPAPIPAGWWHIVAESPLTGTQYANRGIGIGFDTLQKPSVNVEANIVLAAGSPQRFECWIYSSTPIDGVLILPSSDLWRYNRTWPVRQITLEQITPARLTAQDAVTLDLPVAPDGTVALPLPLPTGNYSLSLPAKKPGATLIQGEDKRSIELTFPFDRWKRPLTSFFYMGSPLRQIALQRDKTDSGLKTILLKHSAARSQPPLAVTGKPLVTVDPARTESAPLVMLGTGLTGELPSFTLLPRGLKTAVLTTWDDGKPEDIRCAEILNKHGYRPSFFMNNNSPAMKFLDKLEALNVEVGSHCYNHPSLYAIPPERAAEECVAMRVVLEQALGHPVISMGYPFGYSPSRDADGDYVLRAVKAAGIWSARTTNTRDGHVDNYADLAAMDTNGFFGNARDLEAQWPKTRAVEGGVFYFWGHSWQIGKTDEQWKKFEDFVAQFAHQPDAWYPSQGEFSLWVWSRKNVKITAGEKSPAKTVVTLSRPWLHPWLAAKCPLTLKVPAGVTKVLWQGKEITVADGRVELTWAN
ncbi:MAG: polysaccharide deacetylase family protein [Opitutaceae bacterium]|jgi:hypothetical protein